MAVRLWAGFPAPDMTDQLCGIESILHSSFFGLKRTGNRLAVKPCIPDSWTSFDIKYQFGETEYHLKIERDPSAREMKLLVDGSDQGSIELLLVNDQQAHEVKITLPVVAERLLQKTF